MSEEFLFGDVEQEVEDSVLGELSRLCEKMLVLEKEIESVEENLSLKKKELENISRNLIPSILNTAGLSEVKLNSGYKVIVQDKVASSIVNKNYTLAYRNMINEEGGDERAQEIVDSLFKSQIVIEDISEEVLDLLLDNDVPYDSKRSIHPQTLNKYCRDRLENGKTIPEGISVFQYQETKIKQ
jgi:hypothetical protein